MARLEDFDCFEVQHMPAAARSATPQDRSGMSAFALGGLTQFFNRSTAASAVIVNSGGAAASANVLHRRMIIPHKRLITMEKSAVQ